jgi:hypothetical protein
VSIGKCGLPCLLLKGYPGNPSLGNKVVAVRSEQLKIQSNIDAKKEWRYTNNPPHQSCTNFQKIKESSKNLNIRAVIQSMSHTEDPQLLGVSGRTSVTIATPLSVICSSLLYRREYVGPHQVQKNHTSITIQ